MAIVINTHPTIPPLKKIEDRKKIDVRYMLVPPYASAHIYWDSKINEVIYEIEEPLLNGEERAALDRLEEAMLELININVAVSNTPSETAVYVDKTARLLIDELNLRITSDTYQKLFYYLFRDFIGFNEVDPLLKDYFIEDIECNGVDTPVYIIHRVFRHLKTNLVYKDLDKMASFVEKLAQRAGRYVSYAQPLLDGSLPDGSIDYGEPVIYKEKGVVKVSKIGKIIDKYYEKEDSDKPINVINLQVPAFDKNKFKISWKNVDYVYRHKINEDLYEVKTQFGKKVKLTGCHSIFKLTKEGVKSERTDKLKEGDYVAFPLSLPENDLIGEINLAEELTKKGYGKKFVISGVSEEVYQNKKKEIYCFLKANYKKPNISYCDHKNKGTLPLELFNLFSRKDLENMVIKSTSQVGVKPFLKVDKNLMRFLGLWVAEGWITHTQNHHRTSFCFNKNEVHLLNEIKNISKELFGVNVYFEPVYNNAVKATINSIVLETVLEDVLKLQKYAKRKRVPQIVFNVNNKLQQEFINAWFEGDYGSTASPELKEDICYLSLFNKDIVQFSERQHISDIENRKIKSYEYYTNFFRRNIENAYAEMIPMELFNPLKETHGRMNNNRMNKERLKKILLDLRYQRFKNFKDVESVKFIKEWTKRGFIENGKLSEKGEELLKEIGVVETLLNSDLGFAKINSINKVKSSHEYVYDFSVKDCENFVGGSGGLCCHNSRVNATYTKDVTSRGPTFTIRKFTKVPWTPPQLIAFNTLSPEMLAYFWILIENKSSILIAGGTASGKTTLLNALAFFIPPEMRVVSLEDSVTGDSKIIVRKDGEIKHIEIKEFVDKKLGGEVMTIDEKGKILWVKPSDYIKHKVKKDIYEVETATGRKIKVTKDHSLFTFGEDGLFDNIKPAKLTEGKSFIAVPRSLPIEFVDKNEINLMEHLDKFKNDFLQGDIVKKVFEKYSRAELGVAKERYRWWKNHNLIKVEEFLKLDMDFDYKELKNLRIKSKNTSSIPVLFNINKEFLEFCGLWVGDGSYNRNGKSCVIISNNDVECRNLIRHVADYIGAGYSVMNDKGTSIRIHSTVFYNFMENVLGFKGYSKTKNVPEFIINLSNKQIKHFIRGYFSADGCVKKYEISCVSQSRDLLEGLQTMFLRLNIISRINQYERKDDCIEMSISSSENINKFKEIGFLQERKKVKLNGLNFKAHHTHSDVIPLGKTKIAALSEISNVKLQSNYLRGLQNIGRPYMQKIAPIGSEFNDVSHTDILWDKVKKVTKISSNEIEVFDLSIPRYEKFLCNNIFVHNTREINLPRENWLPAVTRTAVGIGKVGEVDLFSILKSSFRQNPDYLIVGEVRGKEASVLFQGMASGHASLSTMHADSVDTLVRRLQTPPIELSPTLINSLDCVTVATHATIGKQETRRVRDIAEIMNVDKDGTASVNTPFKWDPAKDVFYFKKQSHVLEKISQEKGIPMEELQREFLMRSKLLYELYKRSIFGFEEVEKIINDYYKGPEEVLKKFGIS